jgi:tetratricopeptide (TPR) repeat protein
MTCKTFLVSTAVALLPFQIVAQTDKRIQHKDSVTVSAGVPKEQLVLEDQLNGIVSQGDQLLRSGNAPDAVKQYQIAVDLVQKQPLLAEREYWVLKKLARGYIHANQANDAIPIYARLLDARKPDCESESAAVSNCADAQYELGVAKMHGNDFSGALTLLQEADSKYAKAEKLSSDSHEFAMIQHKSQGETKLMIAVALARTGRTPDALKTFEAAISELTRVQSDATITVGIRDDAAGSLQQAQTILARLKSTQ